VGGPLVVTLTPSSPTLIKDSLMVNVTVTGGVPDRVVLVLDSGATPIFTFTQAPFMATVPFAAVAEGAHQLTARAQRGAQAWDSAASAITVDRTAPSVVFKSPDATNAAAGVTPVWSEPWVVRFDEPVVLGAQAMVTAQTASGPVTLQAPSLSADAQTLTFRATSPMPSAPVTVDVQVGGLADRAGNAVAPLSWSFTASRFSRVTTLTPHQPSQPGVALASDVMYVAFREARGGAAQPDRVQVRRFSPGTSELLPETLSTAASVVPVRVAVDGQGRVVTAFEDGLGAAVKTVVQRLEAGAWVRLTGAELDGLRAPSLALDSMARPVVAGVQGTQLKVLRHDGSGWSSLYAQAVAVAPNFGTRPQVVVGPAGELAVGFGDLVGGRLVARVAVSTGGTFSVSHTQVSPSAGLAGFSLAWGSSGLWLALAEGHRMGFDLNVARANTSGATVTWAFVGRPLDVELRALTQLPAMVLDSTGQPLVAWSEAADEGVARVWTARVDAAGIVSLLSGEDVALGAGVPTAGFASLELAAAQDGFVAAFERASSPASVHVARFNAVGVARPFGMEAFAAQPCNPVSASGAPYNQLLSGNCFRVPDGGGLPIASGDLLPYDLTSPLWSDGAQKRRWVWLPSGATVGFADAGAFAWPVGTVLVKEFSYHRRLNAVDTSRRPLETRLLVKGADGGWSGYTYQWRDDHSNADRLDTGVLERKAWEFADGTNDACFVQLYPSGSMCFRCHNTAAGVVLGPTAAALARTVDYGGVADDQLRTWNRLGLFGAPAPVTAPMASPHSEREPLERRVRGYLAANCAHCHRPGGERPTRDFRWEVSLSTTNLCGVVSPGDAGTSLLHTRFGRLSAPLPPMPPVATDVLDQPALRLVDDWINGLTACP
jgi:hypothetical protein